MATSRKTVTQVLPDGSRHRMTPAHLGEASVDAPDGPSSSDAGADAGSDDVDQDV